MNDLFYCVVIAGAGGAFLGWIAAKFQSILRDRDVSRELVKIEKESREFLKDGYNAILRDKEKEIAKERMITAKFQSALCRIYSMKSADQMRDTARKVVNEVYGITEYLPRSPLLPIDDPGADKVWQVAVNIVGDVFSATHGTSDWDHDALASEVVKEIRTLIRELDGGSTQNQPSS